MLQQQGSFCYKNVERWGNRVDGGNIFKMKKLFAPINLSNTHWGCCVVDMDKLVIISVA
jgi:Ulp1 family protease